MATATKKGHASNVTLRLLVVVFSLFLNDLTAVQARGFRHSLKQGKYLLFATLKKFTKYFNKYLIE